MGKRTLTNKMLKTIDNYMKGMTKQDAMIEAGYSKSVALTRRGDIFDRPDFKAELERRQKLAAHRAGVSLDWIVERLKAIADANIGDILEIDEHGKATYNLKKLTPELRVALTGFTSEEYSEGRGKDATQVKKNRIGLADKLRALELLMRHLGLSKEKVQVEVSGEVSLVERLNRGRARAGVRAKEREGTLSDHDSTGD